MPVSYTHWSDCILRLHHLYLTIGSRGGVSGRRELVIRDDDSDNN
jgi:hypothetical protein